MAKREKANGSRRKGTNAPSGEDLRAYFDEVHDITDDMESKAAGSRAKIGRVWDGAAEKLGVTKTSLKKIFRRERAERKVEDWAKTQADAADREAMEKLGAMLGDSPLGAWATNLSKTIPEAGTDTSSSE